MENLHSGIKKAWTLNSIFISLIVSVISSIFLTSFLKLSFGVGSVFFVIIFFLFLVLSLIVINMSYDRYQFEFKKEGVFIEKGIIFKNYYTIPYPQIQNVELYRGILARVFGYSALMIQTAGYSGGSSGGPMIILGGGRRRGIGVGIPMGGRGMNKNAEGYIPAIEPQRAEEIRSWLMKKISKR